MRDRTYRSGVTLGQMHPVMRRHFSFNTPPRRGMFRLDVSAARYVLQKSKKTEDMSDKARCVRQLFFKSQDMSDMCQTKMETNARHV